MTFPLMCVHISFKFGSDCSVAISVWEGAAHSVDHMFSLYFDYL